MQYSSSATVALQLLSLMGVAHAAGAPYANTTSSAAASTTVASATQVSGIPMASLCPEVNGQVILGPDNFNWTVMCGSDSWTGAYGESDTKTSYIGCMSLCDAQSQCDGFVYVANDATATQGVGAGKCWLKTSMGAWKSAPANYIAASKPAATHTATTLTTLSVSSTSTTSTSATATATPSGVSCPSWNGLNFTTSNGEKFTVQCGVDHYSGNLADFSTTNFTQCIETCSDNSACVDVSFVNSVCWMKSAVGFASNSASVWGAMLVPKGNATLPTVN